MGKSIINYLELRENKGMYRKSKRERGEIKNQTNNAGHQIQLEF